MEMHAKGAKASPGVTLSTLLLLLFPQAHGAEIGVTVLQQDGTPLPGAVVLAEAALAAPKARGPATAVMDQRELKFVPDVLVVRTGTAVDFPNSDRVRHQVYSFSGTKSFKLALYAGRQHPPVVFDKPGLVTVGCNIHDGMIGHILVTDSPWFGITGAHGELRLTGLPEGDYQIRVWHPRSTDAPDSLSRALALKEGHADPVVVQLKRALKPAPHQHGTDKRWDDY
jgi:plastocyanin